MTALPTTLSNGIPLVATQSRSLCVSPEGDVTGEIVGWIGGKALLPYGTTMPHMPCSDGDLEKLSHLATFSTSVLSDVVAMPAGTLTLLYAAKDQPWSYVCHLTDGTRSAMAYMPGMRRGHQVVFVPEGEHTEDAAGGTEFPVRPMVAVDWTCLDIADDVDILKFSDEACDELDAAFDQGQAPIGDLAEAVIVKGPVRNEQQPIEPMLPELGDVVREIASVPDDWICIAQVGSLGGYHEPVIENSFLWGDMGTLYFWVLKEDLAAIRFDRTLCILQCG